jgi:hypothetical protein
VKCFSFRVDVLHVKLIVICTKVLFFLARLTDAGIWISAGAGAGAMAGWGEMTWTGIGIGGAEGTRVGDSLDQQQIFQIQSLTTKVRIAVMIMAAGKVKAQCGSGFCMWSSLSNRIVVSNSPLYFVLSLWTPQCMAYLFPFQNKSVSSPAQSTTHLLRSRDPSS